MGRTAGRAWARTPTGGEQGRAASSMQPQAEAAGKMSAELRLQRSSGQGKERGAEGMQWERTGFFRFPFFLLKSLTKKITLGRREKGKKMGRSVQEPPVPPQDGVPHLWGSPGSPTAQAPGLHYAWPAPSPALLSLRLRQWRPARPPPHPRPEEQHIGHVTLGTRSTYLNPSCSSGSSPPGPALPRGPASARPQRLAPPPPGLAPAHKSLIVWRLRTNCASVLSLVEYIFLSRYAETETSNIFKGMPFNSLFPKAHINSGFHIELKQKNCRGKPSWPCCLPLPRSLATVSKATTPSTTLSNPKRIRRVILFFFPRGLLRRGQRGIRWKRETVVLWEDKSRKGETVKKKTDVGIVRKKAEYF